MAGSAHPETRPTLVRGLGPIATTALVAGNMVGSGIFVIPGLLATVAGPVSLVAWGAVAAAYLVLTSIYADLSEAYPVSGGLQVYAQRAFGDFVGYETAALYWVSVLMGNAAFVTAFVGYLQVIWPGLAAPWAAFAAAQVLLWSLTGVNLLGVKAGGRVQVATTVLKVAPLLVLAIALAARGSPENLVPFVPHGFMAVFPAISLVAWLFVGAESITIPAEEVRDPGRNLRRGAFLGYGIAAGVYLLVAGALAWGLPPSVLEGTASPLAVAARRTLGGWGEGLVTAGALVSIGGVLNGWLLVMGRLPYAAARQGIAPAWLGHVHPRTHVPVRALLVSAGLSATLVLLYFAGPLIEAYNAIVLASTATALVAIGAGVAAYGVLARRDPERFTPAQRRRAPWMSAAALAIVVIMIAGTGFRVFLLTALAIALPAPYHLWRRRRHAAGP